MLSTVSTLARRLFIPGCIAGALILAAVVLTPVHATSVTPAPDMATLASDPIDDTTDGRVGILKLNGEASASYAGLKIFYYAEIQFDKDTEFVLLDTGEPYPTVRVSPESRIYEGTFSITVREPGTSEKTLQVSDGTLTVYPSRAAAEGAIRSE